MAATNKFSRKKLASYNASWEPAAFSSIPQPISPNMPMGRQAKIGVSLLQMRDKLYEIGSSHADFPQPLLQISGLFLNRRYENPVIWDPGPL
jgi:hypothetical protein